MTPYFDSARRRLLAAALVLFGLHMKNLAAALVNTTHYAIKTVANFDATTWRQLLRAGPRPAAYVFSNSFCAICPEVFALLHQTVGASGQSVELVAILMDVRGDRALAVARHYTGATQVYAFDGPETAIRKAIDPKWRNITPYVVLVGRNGRLQRGIGEPDARQLHAWLG
ncbi:MAG: hypothetical protein V4858_12270 [Pseudomonadota bacterium]